MDNSFFILCEEAVTISRFHICTWDIENVSSFVEIGIEFHFPVDLETINFKLVAPFIKVNTKVRCLLHNLIKDSNNSKFIFNDIITNFTPIQGDKRNGAIITFGTREKMNILPIDEFIIDNTMGQVITLNLKKPEGCDLANLCYVRLLIQSSEKTLATKNKGIAQTSFIYDIKLNENRNLPDEVNRIIKQKYKICKVESCFCFHIVPNSFNILFVDQNKLKSVRELEVPAFRNYLDEAQKMKEKKYIIIFNKSSDSNSYSFFTILNKEIIGTKQILFAICANILCSLLFALSSLNINYQKPIMEQIPLMYWLSFGIMGLLLLILFFPFKR
jgi:hypothetical protein